MVFQILAAGGWGVEVTYLIRRVHIAVARPQRHRESVMVGGSLAAVTADETHRRPAVALTGEEQEVADDQSQVI